MDIRLYINDILIDSSPNINLTFSLLYSELTNPTTLRNSFSKTLNIEGTANNDKAFEQYFDWRHRVNSVSAVRRIPFKIFVDNDLFTEGYCKLDKIERKGSWHQYYCTLYGGLGEFLYTLSDKRLCDLSWEGTNGLRHRINKDFIEESWSMDWYHPVHANSFDVHQHLGYVPMFNGTYDDFNNDKVQMGDSLEEGTSVMELAQDIDEWGMKSFRSYKQRPAVRVGSVIEEILDESGYEWQISEKIYRPDNPYWADMFCTLPLLDYHGKEENSSESHTYNVSMEKEFTVERRLNYFPSRYKGAVKSPHDGDFSISLPNPSSGTDLEKALFGNDDGTLNFKKADCDLEIEINPNIGELFAWTEGMEKGDDIDLSNDMYYKFKVYLKDMDSNKEYNLNVSYYLLGSNHSNEEVSDNDGKAIVSGWSKESDGYDKQCYATVTTAQPIKIIWTNRLSGDDGARMKLILKPDLSGLHSYTKSAFSRYFVKYTYDSFKWSGDKWISESIYQSHGNQKLGLDLDFTDVSLKVSVPSQIRSGAYVEWRDMCPDDLTQGDFFLSWLKLFGYFLVKDKYERKITIMTRNEYFSQYNIEDWTDKLDISSNVEIKPIIFDKRYQLFALKENNSGYSKAYTDQYKISFEGGDTVGTQYGSVRVDTNYGFNVDTNELLDGNIFESSLSCEEVILSPYNIRTVGDDDVWACDYRYESDPIRKPCSFEWDGNIRKKVDSSMQLFFRMSPVSVETYYITDDPSIQKTNGEFMHILPKTTGLGNYAVSSTTMPRYVDIMTDNDAIKPVSTLFAKPSKVYFKLMGQGEIEGETYHFVDNISSDGFIYPQFWKNYIHDLYDENTEIVTMYFNLTPRDIMMFNFYNIIMVNNVLYVVNKIDSFNLTKEALTKVELIRINDLDNYVNGQTLKYAQRWFRILDTSYKELSSKTINPNAQNVGILIDSSSNDWELRSDPPDWVTISYGTTDGRYTPITVGIDINGTGVPRTVELTFIQFSTVSSEEILRKTLRITQIGRTPPTPPSAPVEQGTTEEEDDL